MIDIAKSTDLVRNALKNVGYQLGPVYVDDKALDVDQLLKRLDEIKTLENGAEDCVWFGWILGVLTARDVISTQEIKDLLETTA